MLISLPASATMTGRRRPRRGQNGSREQPFWSVAAIIVVLVVSYWYGGGDDDATAAQITDKIKIRSVREQKDQCRASCEDIILEAAAPNQRRGSSRDLHGDEHGEKHSVAAAAAIRSVIEDDSPPPSSDTLSTSAVDALFHRRRKIFAEEDPSQRDSPSLAEAASGTGVDTSTSSAVGSSTSPKSRAAARPLYLPPLIEALVGSVDLDATQNDTRHKDGRSRRDLIRWTKVEKQSARQSSLHPVIKGGDTTTKAAAAAVATFWSSLQSRRHTLVGRPSRMKNVNQEWDAALRWIAGWGKDELNADAAAAAASKTKKANAFKRRGRIQSRKASRSGQSATKWDMVEEASELLLLIDMCVDRCGDIMAEDTARGNKTKRRRPTISGDSSSVVTSTHGSRSARVFMPSVLPGEYSLGAFVAGILGLFLSSILIYLLHFGYDWALLWRQKKDPNPALVSIDKEHGDRVTFIGKSGGKKGRRKKKKSSPSSHADGPTRQIQEQKSASNDREEVPRAKTVQLSKSPSQTSLSDDDDANWVGLIRTTKSSTPTSSDSLVRAPTSTRVAQHNSTSANPNKHSAASECNLSGQHHLTPRRQKKRKNRNNRSRQKEFPVPTEAQRQAAHKQLQEFQSIQRAKLIHMRKEAKLAAERVASVRKKASAGLSYSSVAGSSSPPLSPPRPMPQALVVGQKDRKSKKETKDAVTVTENAFSSTATSPGSNIATPCRDFVQDHPLDDVAGELLLTSISGMLDEADDEYEGEYVATFSIDAGKSGVSPPPGFRSHNNATTFSANAEEHHESPRDSDSPALGTRDVVRSASSTWSSQGHQSGVARSSFSGSYSGIW